MGSAVRQLDQMRTVTPCCCLGLGRLRLAASLEDFECSGPGWPRLGLNLQLLCGGPAGSLGPEAKRRLHWHDVWYFRGLYYSVGLGRLCQAASLEASLGSEGQRADSRFLNRALIWVCLFCLVWRSAFEAGLGSEGQQSDIQLCYCLACLLKPD